VSFLKFSLNRPKINTIYRAQFKEFFNRLLRTQQGLFGWSGFIRIFPLAHRSVYRVIGLRRRRRRSSSSSGGGETRHLQRQDKGVREKQLEAAQGKWKQRRRRKKKEASSGS
jgi:hypothetical protein